MPRYTCITENRGNTHISQHFTDTPDIALKEHIKSIPFIEGINPIGDELYWIQNIALGKSKITLRSMSKYENIWRWCEGENYLEPYTTYIILTVTNN